MTSTYVLLCLHNSAYIWNIIVLKNRTRFQITVTKRQSLFSQSTLPHCNYATFWNTAAKKISRHRSSHVLETQVYSRFINRPTILLLQNKSTPQTLNTPTYTYTLPILPSHTKYIHIILKKLFTVFLTAGLDGTTTLYMGFVPSMLYQYEPKWNSCSTMGVHFMKFV